MHKSLLLKLRFKTSPLWVIFEISFLRNLAAASLTAILPLYFRSFVDSDAGVAGIFMVGYLAAVISNFYSGHIIEHLKKRTSLLIALMGFTLIFFVFAMATHVQTVIFLFALYQFILALFVMDVSLYIKHYSNFKELAGNAGKLGSLGNLGWIIGPLLGSLIADTFGFEAVFFFSTSVSLIALIVFFLVRIDADHVAVIHQESFWSNLKRLWRTPNLRRTYLNNAGLGFIYSLWDFLPLLMIGLGATLPVIGMTKTLMGVPQSIFEFPIGRLADRETGERKIFIVGYALMVIFTLLLGFATNLRVFITCFFIAATGSSFLEMTRDSYFFRQIGEKDVELVAVYRTSDTLPHLVGQICSALFLIILPLKWWFIVGAAVSSVFIINAYFLKDLPHGQRTDHL